jgi:hypothetical protein
LDAELSVTKSEAIAQAFDVIRQIREPMRNPVGDAVQFSAMLFIADGGPMALTDEQYTEALLALANQSDVDDISFATASAADLAAWSRDQKLLIDLLSEILTDPNAAYRRHKSDWLKQIRGRVLTVHAFDAERELRVVPDGTTAKAYVLRLLTQPPYDKYLRRCQLESCRHFFLDTETRQGMRLKYCPDPCTDIAKREKTRERARQWRIDHKAPKSARKPK